MDFRSLYTARHSTRSFTSRALSAEEIETLLDAAIHAPNACNAQCWRFYVIQDKKTKEALAQEKICAPWVATAPVVFALGADPTPLTARFGDRAHQFVLQDTALAAENMLLAATELHLGGCIIGAFDEAKARQLLQLPESVGIHMLLPIGEAAETPINRGRLALDDVVQYIGEPDAR